MAIEYTESIERVVKDLVPQLPGAIRSVIARECRLAMREFFERSLAWIVEIDGIAIPTGDQAIQITDGDPNTEVISILRVAVGEPDGNFTELPAFGRPPLNITSTNSDPVGWYVTSNPDEIKLHPYQEVATTKVLRVTAGLIPAFDIDVNDLTLPRQITLKFYDAILNGTLARLYMHPNKPYSQPVLGTKLRHNFLRQIGYYAAQRKKGFNNSQMWRFPSGWSPSLRQRHG